MVVFCVVVQWLFETLVGLSPAQQRQFLCFATGSPRLPIGGTLTTAPPPLTRAVWMAKCSRNGFGSRNGLLRRGFVCPGLSALTPALTIVRRGTDGDGDNPDHFLPSVRTPPPLPCWRCRCLLFVLGECLGQCKLRKGRLWMCR